MQRLKPVNRLAMGHQYWELLRPFHLALDLSFHKTDATLLANKLPTLVDVTGVPVCTPCCISIDTCCWELLCKD